MLRNVYLVGSLGKRFGYKWQLDVETVQEALRAIDVNTKGKFVNFFKNEGSKKYYKIALQNKKNLINVEKELAGPIGNSDIYIMPTLKGSGNNGWSMLAVAVVLAIVTYGASAYAQAAGWAAKTVTGIQYIGYSTAVSMALGGITQLLTPIPSFGSTDTMGQEDRGSQLFQGNANTISQGGSVGIIYGRVLVMPMPISTATETTNSSTTNTNQTGTVEENELEGGGVEYVT